jgi:BirA family biotin operon repressor/biotin-[acetyl-CoA-carboxylase] ligase
MQVIHFKSINSTHLYAVERLEKGVTSECVIVADVQNKGIGRCHRTWNSTSGNLFMSIIKRIPSANFAHVSMTVAAAAHEGIARCISDATALKLRWPNDIYYCGRKLSGILLSKSDDNIVISVGVNIVPVHDILNAISLQEISPEIKISRDDLLNVVVQSINSWIQNLYAKNFSYIKEYWLRNINEFKCKITIKNGSDQAFGIFEDIDDSGRLVLAIEGGARMFISSGDLFLYQEGIRVDEKADSKR